MRASETGPGRALVASERGSTLASTQRWFPSGSPRSMESRPCISRRRVDSSSTSQGDDASACVSNKLSFPLEPGLHVASCTPIVWSSNPPTSGQHYPVWAAFKTYAAPVPRGFLVHALEHGAVVFTYNCPGGCAADIAALQAMLDARAADPLCVAPLKNRFIISPDPLLDSRFAASAWEVPSIEGCWWEC